MDMEIFRRLASRRYSNTQRLLAIIAQGILFGALGPFVVVYLSLFLDCTLELGGFRGEAMALIFGVLFVIEGFAFTAWTVMTQYRTGKGTPSPLMPTRRLVVEGPFAFCRNPMTFGTFFFYLGVSLMAGSPVAVAMTIFLFSLLLVYIKTIEEKELEARFGQEYLTYRGRTSFIIPRRFTGHRPPCGPR
ncbi:MAG: isoprenylcysteine carboxylmethyltransferase family protein [Deltaproteobacteria bacterium]|nr:isoprenylcysteine carboxylmethyltransferase family protein [Deltaproteobacteria bacterium]